MTSRIPPKFVPTLTEVVQRPQPSRAGDAALGREERIAQRVLDRLELDLDKRLREVVASLIVEQTRTLGPLLREELKASVREAVAEALAQERQGE